jgi:hypothetical protein
LILEYSQPVSALHESTVQALKSLQVRLRPAQIPVDGSHEKVTHSLESGQLTKEENEQVEFTQEGAVHKLLSKQVSNKAEPVFGAVTHRPELSSHEAERQRSDEEHVFSRTPHPEETSQIASSHLLTGLGQITGAKEHLLLEQVASKQGFADGQAREAFFDLVIQPKTGSQKCSRQISSDGEQVTLVFTHPPPEQVSTVHRLLSSHNDAISLADLSTNPQPLPSEQNGFIQISFETQLAPMSVTSQDDVPALQV